MSERERWIVYPLLFFALGAALRDKFTQQVRTDRLHAGQISCEELLVLDSEKPDRIVAKLSSNPPQRNGDRYGVFVLIDSEGKEFCEVQNDQLFVNNIACRAVNVLDPLNPARPLALLTSGKVTMPDKSTRRIGSLLLTDSEGRELFGLADDQLKMRQIICEGIVIVDPQDPSKSLVLKAPGGPARGVRQPSKKKESSGNREAR
jgi:hypothetical protein